MESERNQKKIKSMELRITKMDVENVSKPHTKLWFLIWGVTYMRTSYEMFLFPETSVIWLLFNVHCNFELIFVSITSQHDRPTSPMRFNPEPPSPALANIHSTLGSESCWLVAAYTRYTHPVGIWLMSICMVIYVIIYRLQCFNQASDVLAFPTGQR